MGAASKRAILSVSPDTFPALIDCRANTEDVERDCPRYDTILVRYFVTEGQELPPDRLLRLSFGWPYNGGYLTHSRYTKRFGWPKPQVDYPAESNFVAASVANGSSATTATHLEVDQGRVLVQFDREVVADSVVEIVLGDTSGGGPGYAIPALGLEIDLVVETGTTEEGFHLVANQMPRLRIVGTQVDGFKLLAPSTANGEFELVIQALEGIEGRLRNRYPVPGYTGTVLLSSTDPHAELPAEYTFSLADGGVAHVPVTLSHGTHTISLMEKVKGQTASSNPVRVQGPVWDRTKQELVLRPRRNVYWGVLQQHTAVGGHAAQSPQFAFEYARNVARLDFLALTEHCATADYRTDYSYAVARQYDEPGRFVTFEGFEWSSLSLGHRHVLYRDGSGQPGLCDRDRGDNPTVVPVPTLEDLEAALVGLDALVIPHHTAWHQQPRDGVMANVVLGSPSWKQQGLFEVYGNHGSSECAGNEPYVIHDDPAEQWGADKKVFFRDALEQGFRFGVVAGTDNHFGRPGGEVEGARSYSRAGLTAVYADELTRDGIWDALTSRRTYGTTGARILLDFGIAGREMGQEFIWSEPVTGRISVVGTEDIAQVEVYRNGHQLAHTFTGSGRRGEYSFADEPVPAGETYSYYVRVIQTDDHMAWSSPIWVQGAAPAASPTEHLSVAPNPFNPSTTIRYSLASRGPLRLTVFDVTGRRVRTLIDEVQAVGPHSQVWRGVDERGENVSSGVYLLQMRTAETQMTRKLLLIR